jgi:DNA-binding CsgD family transcriptional regulator
MQILDAMVPVVRSVLRHHWIGSDYPEHATGGARSLASLQDHIQNAFRQFGRSLLTNRESEIVGLILSGYSSNAISQHLDISVGTVKIHRKNTYQKLSISSQNELFSMFLSSLSDPSLLADDLENPVEDTQLTSN